MLHTIVYHKTDIVSLCDEKMAGFVHFFFFLHRSNISEIILKFLENSLPVIIIMLNSFIQQTEPVKN